MQTVKRYDFGTIRSVQRTPQGGIVVPAALTRIGVFEYQLPDGHIRRELRLPEEVFRPESLESLKRAPVTDLHPAEMVTPENWQRLAVGHVAEDVRGDGFHVLASLVVQDAEAIRKIDDGERKELSCGYHCTLEMTPGEYNGEPYDAIQRGIVYNHVALGPEGWARGGSTCALRLDSQDAIQIEREQMSIIRIDGVDYTFGSAEHVAKLNEEIEKLRKSRDAEQGRADALQAKLDAANAEIAKLLDVKRFDGIIKARTALYALAKTYLGKRFDCSDKSDREIKIAIIKRLDSKIKIDGKSDDYIDGVFQALTRKRRDSDDPDDDKTDEDDDPDKDEDDKTDEDDDPDKDEDNKTDEDDDPDKDDESRNDGRISVFRRARFNKLTQRVDTATAAAARMRKDSATAYQKPLLYSKDK